MQNNNYIFVYNKPNSLKIGWKSSKLWWFKKYMLHRYNVMSERADCSKMAAMWLRRSPLASRAGELSSLIYVYGEERQKSGRWIYCEGLRFNEGDTWLSVSKASEDGRKKEESGHKELFFRESSKSHYR